MGLIMTNRPLNFLILFGACVFMTTCSLSDRQAPTNLDNACAIIQQKPKWYFDMLSVERSYQLPSSVQMAIIWQESKFIATAKTPRKKIFGFSIPWKRQSSAYGFAQVIDGTWEWYKEVTGKRFVSRTNFRDAVEFIGWYSDITTHDYGIAKTDIRNQYLAYHEGHTGFKNKSYSRKLWLIDVANNLVDREAMYRNQLRGCRI